MARTKTTYAKVTRTTARGNEEDDTIVPRPFLRWAGGKFHLARLLTGFVPQDVASRVYHEPFLGAASMFFALRHPNAHLSDLNGHLIGCYRAVRDDPTAVAKVLREHAAHDSEDHYYDVREAYNRSRPSRARAARFLYLNRTCFNGVFRVNTKGAFNVPYGHKESPRFPSTLDLVRVSAALSHATLEEQDFETALLQVEKGDFVYLDPPYPPLNGTSYFTHYTAERFGQSDQEKVAENARKLAAKGCLFLLSIADTPMIRRLYRGFQLRELSVTRFVSSSRAKHRVSELLIANYPLPKLAERQSR